MAATIAKELWLGNKLYLKNSVMVLGTGAPADSDLLCTDIRRYPKGTIYVSATGAYVRTAEAGVAADFAAYVTAGQAADAGALTDNSGGAAADGTIGVITSGTPADLAAQAAINTQIRDAIKELATKINTIRTNLRSAGLMA